MINFTKWLLTFLVKSQLSLIKFCFQHFKGDNKISAILVKFGYHYAFAQNPTIIFKHQPIRKGECARINSWLLAIPFFLLKFMLRYDLTMFSDKLKQAGLIAPICEKIQMLFRSAKTHYINDFSQGSSGDKIAVYTVLTGNYEKLYDPIYVSDKCDYILNRYSCNKKPLD